MPALNGRRREAPLKIQAIPCRMMPSPWRRKMKKRGTTLREFLGRQMRNGEFRKAYAQEDLPARLAVRIAELREKRGMTQQALARRLRVSQQALSLLENPSTANYTLRTLQRLAAALDKDLVVEFR